MLPLEFLVKAGIYGLMVLGIVAALGAVTLHNLFHAGLALALTLITVAGIYLALGAEFLAMVQILLYVGGVMTLVIYTIMLTGRLGDPGVETANKQGLPAVLGGICLAAMLAGVFARTPWPAAGMTAAVVSVADLGTALMGTYVFPFEVLGILLFAVLIGAIVMARQDRNA